MIYIHIYTYIHIYIRIYIYIYIYTCIMRRLRTVPLHPGQLNPCPLGAAVGLSPYQLGRPGSIESQSRCKHHHQKSGQRTHSLHSRHCGLRVRSSQHTSIGQPRFVLTIGHLCQHRSGLGLWHCGCLCARLP